MKTMKKTMALLLVFVLVAAYVPLSAFPVFAEEAVPAPTEETVIPNAEEQLPSGEETVPLPATEPESTEPSMEATESTETEPEEIPQESPNPSGDLSNEFGPEVQELLEELFPDGNIPADFDLSELLAEMEPLGGSSGSEIGDGGDGGGNSPGSGASNMIAAGVTMQIVYYRYDQCFNRYNSHGCVINTLQTGNAIPWNSTGRDQGAATTTVFDTFTISPHTFLVKARWDSYPYVYHFPGSGLHDDNCSFDWADFTRFWFIANNPGKSPETYPYIVRNEPGGSYAIEQFLAKIILGNDYGAWDKLDVAKGETVATDTSLFTAVLKYLGASDLAIQNYLNSYYGKLSVSQDGDTLIPTIIWSWVGAENLGITNRLYTIGDVAANGSTNGNWLKTAYTSSEGCNNGFGACSWMRKSTDTMICKLMLGGTHYPSHGTTIWKSYGSSNLFGTGFVNRIQTQVDATAENGSNTFYYLRGYWTPYGTGNGSISLTKTNAAGNVNLAGAEFTLYRDAACTVPVTSADYAALSTSDAGYVSASVRRTNVSGRANWTGLYTGTYFLKETKAPEGYRVNVDASGNVQVKEVAVGKGASNVTLTNVEKIITGKIQITKKIANQIDGTSAPEAGAKFSVTDKNGTVVDTIVTGDNGVGTSTDLHHGTYTVKQISGQAGTILCDPWEVTVSENGKVYAYTKENPLWTASVSIHKKEAGTDIPLVAAFELCERLSDGTVKVLETGTTNADGDFAFSRKIVYADGICNKSSYFLREKAAPAGFLLDTTEYPVSCASSNQKISVTVENAPVLGKLELRKQSSLGEAMQGVKFLLEYSLDNGKTWSAVTTRDEADVVVPGSCTSENLDADGTLMTDDKGIALFDGLRVYTSDGAPILYRATELQTLNGSSLMPDHIWEGDLSSGEQFEVVLGVVNSPNLELPETGSTSARILSVFAALFAVVGAVLLITRRKKAK